MHGLDAPLEGRVRALARRLLGGPLGLRRDRHAVARAQQPAQVDGEEIFANAEKEGSAGAVTGQ